VFGGVVEKRKSSTTTHCIVLVRCGRNRRAWREDSSSEGGGNRYSIGRLSCQRVREFTLSDPVAACSQSPVRSTCSCCLNFSAANGSSKRVALVIRAGREESSN
jgi:hypothetical protein